MNIRLLAVTLAATTIATTIPRPAPAAEPAVKAIMYGIDRAHSAVEFTIGFMGLSKVRGRFAAYEGTVLYDPEDPTRSSVTAVIETASIDTDNDWRDKDLKSPAFFDVETYPQITFQSRSFERSGDVFVMTGAFTMHGVTKELKIPVTMVHPEMLDAWGNRRIGFMGTVTIDRREFGVVGGKFWNQTLDLDRLAVSNDVDIALSISATVANMDRHTFDSRKKPSIGEEITRVLESEGLDAALARYAELEKTQADAFNFGPNELNIVGYRLLGHDRVVEAVAVFRLNMASHPDVWQLHDSLAEALAKRGDRSGAIREYEAVLAASPKSTSAIEMLRHLRGEPGKLTLTAEP